MPRHVLVALDGSDQAQAALEHALTEMGEVRLTLLHVINPAEAGLESGSRLPTTSEEWYETATDEAATLLSDAAERCEERGVPAETATDVGMPARVITEVASDRDVDHVVLGSHGRSGVSRMLLGSVAEAVVRRSPVPVTVVR